MAALLGAPICDREVARPFATDELDERWGSIAGTTVWRCCSCAGTTRSTRSRPGKALPGLKGGLLAMPAWPRSRGARRPASRLPGARSRPPANAGSVDRRRPQRRGDERLSMAPTRTDFHLTAKRQLGPSPRTCPSPDRRRRHPRRGDRRSLAREGKKACRSSSAGVEVAGHVFYLLAPSAQGDERHHSTRTASRSWDGEMDCYGIGVTRLQAGRGLT